MHDNDNEDEDWDEIEDKPILVQILHQKVRQKKETFVADLQTDFAMFKLRNYENCDQKCIEITLEAYKIESLATVNEAFEDFQKIIEHYTQSSKPYFKREKKKEKT